MAGGWCVRSREGFGIVGDASNGMVLLTMNVIDVFTRATRRVTVLHRLSRLKEYTKKVHAPSEARSQVTSSTRWRERRECTLL